MINVMYQSRKNINIAVLNNNEISFKRVESLPMYQPTVRSVRTGPFLVTGKCAKFYSSRPWIIVFQKNGSSPVIAYVQVNGEEVTFQSDIALRIVGINCGLTSTLLIYKV